MNDDEEFEASPNEYSSEEDEETGHNGRGEARDQNNNKFNGSSFGRDGGASDVSQFQPKKWGNVGSSYSRDREPVKEPTPGNARNFFQQKDAETPELPTSVSGAAAMFGGKLKPAGQRNWGKTTPTKAEPTNIHEQIPRKSIARERSMSRDRDGTTMNIERTRTRGESRERPRRAESRRRTERNESKDRTRNRSEDRISAAPSIRRTKSRSRRDQSLKRAERDLSVDRDKRVRDRSEDRDKTRRRDRR